MLNILKMGCKGVLITRTFFHDESPNHCFVISQSISSDLKELTVKYILPYGRCTGLLLGWWSLLHGVDGGHFFTYSLLFYYFWYKNLKK